MPRRLPANLRQALSLAEAALEATADGLLFVNRRGRITGFNRRFVRMWRLPKRVVDSHDDAKAIAFVLGQLRDPGAFGARIRALYSRPRQESFDVIDFKDGRVFERYSRPQVIGARVVGRVWSFRDVTQARQLERDLAEISGREQAKLSRELHDTVAQTLTAISLLARAGVSRNADKPVADRFRRIDQLGRTGLSQVRTTARGLMPPELEKADLESSLKTLESTARELFGIACSVSVRGDARIAEPGAAVELYRVAQEAVFNAGKHSKGRRVRVSFMGAARSLKLSIQDDGVGPPPAGRPTRGLGLSIMRNRARVLGGTLSVRKAGRKGTLVLLECPRPV